MCGAFGVLAPGFLATSHNYANAYFPEKVAPQTSLCKSIGFCSLSHCVPPPPQADRCSGVAYGGSGAQLGANAVAVVAIALWSGACSYVLFKSLSLCGLLRVSEEVEDRGMDSSEHGRENPIGVVDTQAPATLDELEDDTRSEPTPVKQRPSQRSSAADVEREPGAHAPAPKKKKKKETELTTSV